jgi:hypothetical protein
MRRLDRDIAALADGSHEAPGLRERIAADPGLAAVLAEQTRAVEVTRAARPSAPPTLRAALAAAPRAPAPRPRRPALGLVVAAAGVLALGVVAILQRGGGPSVTAVVAIAARGPAVPAPGPDPSHRGALRTQLDGVRYPYLERAFGWVTTGARTDRLDGRPTMTVYYSGPGHTTAGYTIVGGAGLPEPSGARVLERRGTRYLTLTRAGRSIVTWRRAGHTCVMSATGVPLPTLVRLAQWGYDATRA